MRKLSRAGAVIAVCAAMAVATVDVAAAKTVSNEKYAKQLCTAFTDILEGAEAAAPPATDDPATYQQNAVQATDELITSIETAQKKLKKLSPDDGGTNVTKLFNKYFTELVTEIESARDTLAAADPSSPAFVADVTTFEVSLQTLDATLGDPFSDVTQQDLLQAFGDESGCEDVVTVTGG